MNYIKPFDPWRAVVCTCPPKYNLNVYTGCAHGCIYCYSTSFIKDFYRARIKRDFLKYVRRDLKALPDGAIITISNSSDPYQPLEEKYRYTRMFLEMVYERKEKDLGILILTKSSRVREDVDIISRLNAVVCLTITSIESKSKIEPYASSYEDMLNVAKTLKANSVPLVIRIDPVIPFINVDEAYKILKDFRDIADHFVISTYKARLDSFKRIALSFPNLREKLYELYFVRGVKIGNSYYLPPKLRKELLTPFIDFCLANDLSISTCREAISCGVKSKSCDGSHLLRLKSPAY